MLVEWFANGGTLLLSLALPLHATALVGAAVAPRTWTTRRAVGRAGEIALALSGAGLLAAVALVTERLGGPAALLFALIAKPYVVPWALVAAGEPLSPGAGLIAGNLVALYAVPAIRPRLLAKTERRRAARAQLWLPGLEPPPPTLGERLAKARRSLLAVWRWFESQW